MRKVLLAGTAAVALLAALPDRSHAWGQDPYNAHGFGWLGQFAFNKAPWIHQDGPLFSYGPYYGPGYVNMHIPKPWHGSYTPADPNLWNQGPGVYGSMLPAPAAGYAPHAVPPVGGLPRPYISAAPQYAPQYYYPNVVPAGYYPGWMTGR
jgi:hypothetical protein